MTMYVTPDGTYGDAAEIVFVDDSQFTDFEWQILDEVSDNYRMDIASALQDWIRDGRPQLTESEELQDHAEALLTYSWRRA